MEFTSVNNYKETSSVYGNSLNRGKDVISDVEKQKDVQKNLQNKSTFPEDKKEISAEYLKKSENDSKIKESTSNAAQPELSEEEKEQIKELKKTEQNVKTHEQAHVAAGGGYIKGGVKYSYKTGPDNRKYAVSGKVNIDISPVKGDAGATIRKMQTVKRAALAPSDPSPQDRQIASRAAQIEAKARVQSRREGELENDIKNNDLSKASKNKFIEEYKKQQDISNNLTVPMTPQGGVLSKRV